MMFRPLPPLMKMKSSSQCLASRIFIIITIYISILDLCTHTYFYKYVKFQNILSWLLLKNMVTTQMETIIYIDDLTQVLMFY